MCGHCVIESVKERMLSRRKLFAGAGTLAAGAALGAAGGRPAMASSGTVADMTHELHADFPTYFGTSGFKMDQTFNFAESGFNLFELAINEHTGTHMDAPLHFSADGQSVDAIPVDNLVVPLCVIDIRARAAADADTQVTPEDIKAWESANGDIPQGACIAMNSGWSAHVGSDMFRNADADGKMHFPGFHIEATQMLLEQGNAVGMAVDTLSLDHGPSEDFVTHYAWLPTNRWGLECLANLDAVPASGATLFVGAPKFKGGSGGPTRAIAVV